MRTMKPVNRVIRKRVAKPAPAPVVPVEPQTAEPETPFVADEIMIVAHGVPARFFVNFDDAMQAAYELAWKNPGLWVERYQRLDSPGWMLWELIGVPVIDATFAGKANSYIVRVQADEDSCK